MERRLEEVERHIEALENRHPLTEEEIEDIVAKVTKRVMDNFYMQVGKTVSQKILWLIGLVAVSLAVWLAGSGKLKMFD